MFGFEQGEWGVRLAAIREFLRHEAACGLLSAIVGSLVLTMATPHRRDVAKEGG